jgi:hypothetical protein
VWKWIAVGLALPVLLVLVGIGVAKRFGGDDTTKQLALFGAAVSVGGFLVNYLKNGYDVLEKQRERKKKEEEHKEKLTATPRIVFLGEAVYIPGSDLGILSVDIYNDGSAPVSIKRVYLRFRCLGPSTTQNLVEFGTSKHQCKLESKASINFFISPGTDFNNDWFYCRQPEQFEYDIVVDTFATPEIVTVDKAKILAAIEQHQQESFQAYARQPHKNSG